jgi:hypothetical protein
MGVLLSLGGVFVICVLFHLNLMKKIARATGFEWNLNRPFERINNERKALKALGPSRLRTQYKAALGIGVGAWLAIVGWMVFREVSNGR